MIGIRWAREVAKALASPVLRPLGWDAASAVVPRPPTNLLAVPEFPDATNHDSDDLLAAHLTTVVLDASLAWCCHVYHHEIHVNLRHIEDEPRGCKKVLDKRVRKISNRLL